MNVALAYHTADRDRAIEWLTQCAKWGALAKHTLYLLPAFDCLPIPEIVPFIGLTDYLRVSSDWRQADGVRHANANGPNSMFVQFARYFYDNKLGPWFFCESDCIVLKPHSFDKLEEEYIARGKPFMGGYAPAPVPHINGNLIAPENAALIPTLMLPMKSSDGTRDIAFDVAAAREILPQAHATELIQHLWRGPSFTSQEDFDTRIRPDALFYHQCRDGSIYKYLSPSPFVTAPTTNLPIPNCGCGDCVDVTKMPEQSGNGFFHQHLEPKIPLTEHSAILSDGKVRSPTKLELQRERMAAARTALAAKRATGWKPGKRKAKRKKRQARRRHAQA